MKLADWLEKHERSQAWLARRLNVSPAYVSQCMIDQRDNGIQLPEKWAVTVTRVTYGDVSFDDEWPEKVTERKET